MSSEQPRSGRPTGSSSPAGSTIAIVIAVVAVVAGFFILKQIRDDDGGGSGGSGSNTTLPTQSTVDPTQTIASTTPPSTVFTPVTAGTKVQVANAANQDGVAGRMTKELAAKGFDMAEAESASVKTGTTKVLYVDTISGAKAVADSVAYYLGGATVEVATTPVQTKSATLPEGTGVLVMLGDDKAGKTIADLTGATSTTGSGSDTTTTT